MDGPGADEHRRPRHHRAGAGPSFWHAGYDLLRSKSLDRNSFDSGDWFNRIDWSATESTWGSGLPPSADNAAKWAFMRPLLDDAALEPLTGRPRGRDHRRCRPAAHPLLVAAVPARYCGRIQDRVAFPIGGPDSDAGRHHDDARRPRRQGSRPPAGKASSSCSTPRPTPRPRRCRPSPARRTPCTPCRPAGADAVVKAATYNPATGAFTVPARTVAVFVTR